MTESMVAAAGKGRNPMFMEQFDGLRRAGVELPILYRPLRPEELVAGRETGKAANSFEELNRKIMVMLRAFQGN